MSRRLIPLTVALCALLAASAQASTLGSWNLGEQHEVRLAGLMHNYDDARFHGERPLTGIQLRQALDSLAARFGSGTVPTPNAQVSVLGFDRLLIGQLGLTDVATAVQHEARHAGLNPPAYFGTEVVARLLGLRTNHPDPHEELELYPWDKITRAEAAHSFAVALNAGPDAAAWARETLAQFVLPRYTAAQRRVLRIAVSKIGMPYVWGGETDRGSSYFGGQEHGGYDCSGFAWRVFKIGNLPWGTEIHGRTAAAQAGEIPRSQRIRLDAVQPADLVFFGPGRFWQRATERRITHMGIALSNEWMIHASSQGVYVSALFDVSRVKHFSWARRLL